MAPSCRVGPVGAALLTRRAASVANFGTKAPSSVTCVPEFGFPVCGGRNVAVPASSGAGAYSEEAAAFSSVTEARILKERPPLPSSVWNVNRPSSEIRIRWLGGSIKA